jgi:hypothetical protein
MKNNNCYIEFGILSDKYFIDLKRTFDLIKEAKNSGRPQSDEFWVRNFPEYSLKQFFFMESDKKPSFQTAQQSEFIWHFYSLTSLLHSDYDIEYVDCFKLSETCGRIEYAPFGYPYGGITGLIVFISSFKCKPTIIDDGTSVYQITFKENGDFAITDLKDPQMQDSSVKRFEGVDLLRKFWNRLK